MKKTNTQKGITLIALIITIVVLLILAVVAIRAVQGDGILSYAKNARDDYQAAQDEEEAMLQNYLNVLNEETKTETDAGREEYEAVPVGTNCEKYYVDVDKEVEGPEGIIYIDIANTTSGSWQGSYSYTITNVTTGLKEYYVSKESHTTTEFGTAPVLSLVPGSTGTERFYVMALEDVNKGTGYCWYDAAYDYNDGAGISDYATVTSSGIGAGKTNTETMITKWNAEAYGAKNDNGTFLDMWGVVEDGWYIPSECEWFAFASTFSVTSSNYSNLGLDEVYFSSSLTTSRWSPFVNFLNGFINPLPISAANAVRLSTTF